MAEVSIVHIEIDGQEEVNIKKVYEGKIVKRKAVNLMHRTGKIRVRSRPTVGFDLAISEGVAERNYEDMEDVAISIIYEDGSRVRYQGCSHESTGEVTYDEENEAIKRIDFIANTRYGRE
ncbi:MAG: hypothetical protein HXX17_15700 [Geobacteraceae bacterium]|nr:hypothetical protein [Geobacteraceae bacterium]